MRTALCFASLQTSVHSRYIPRYRPNPIPGQQPPFFLQRGLRGIAAIKLELRRRASQTALCFALGFVSAVANLKLGLRSCALRIALVLQSCDFRAGAAALRCSALHCASDTDTCQDMFSRQTCVTRPP